MMVAPNLRLPEALGIRPAKDSDKHFIASLYRATRSDLRLIDAETEFIETLIGQQQQAQAIGYGGQFPNALYFIVEHHGEAIGRLVVDFGPNEIRLVDIALIPEVRSQGYALGILRALKHAAGSVCVPLVLTVYKQNLVARHLYEKEGFCIERGDDMVDLMTWYPSCK
jgi:ribosomal protein S18 acetylase RimI-like enzyme